jgi:hypothetical protein
MSDVDGPGDLQPHDERDDRPEVDIDAAFAAIIEGFSAPSPHGVGPWPASEDLDDDEPTAPTTRQQITDDDPSPRGDPRAEELAPPPSPPSPPADRHGGVVRRIVLSDADADEHDLDDEGFVPPDPPPLPRGDLISRLAWGAVIGGPVFLLVAALAWRTLPAVLLLVALLAFVAGFVTLVARMPAEHPDDPDDGAVV